MNSTPLISIILPNYNHKRFLKDRFESIHNQTYQNFEIIILDDCSTDGSQELIKEWEDHKKVSHILFNDRNSGSSFLQWRRGIELSKGDYIWIAESDDYCNIKFLEKIVAFIKLNNQISLNLIYTQSLDIDENNNVISERLNYTRSFRPNIWQSDFMMESNEFVISYLYKYNVIPNASGVLFKRKHAEGLLSEEGQFMKMCGDWLFWIKLLSQDGQMAFISDNLNYFRNHAGVTRNHHSLKKKKLRVKEEATIRGYLENTFSRRINQKKEIEKMYLNWIRLSRKQDLLTKEFYNILITNYKCFFIFLYFKTKINKILI